MASAKNVEITETIQLPVVNVKGESVGNVEIDPRDFGGKINPRLMHEAVVMYLANQRSGTHKTKTRAEVAGSTKKLFKQKGTGNARVGNKRTNKRRGGGTAKGPRPRDYSYYMPRKAIRSATRMAILSKLIDKEAIIVDSLSFAAPKTSEMVGILKAVKIGKSVLLTTAAHDANVYKSGRNIAGVEVLAAGDLNTYMVLRQRTLLLTKDAFELLRSKAKTQIG